MLKKFFLSVLVMLVVLTVIGFFLPKDYEVKRTQPIEASPEAIVAFVTDLKTWPEWSAWGKEAYPNCVWTFDEDGKSMSWDGPDAGKGRLTITEATSEVIRWDMGFGEEGMDSKGGLLLETTPTGTQVSWFMSGRLEGPIGGWMNMMIDGMVGPYFEENLNSIKELVEAEKDTLQGIPYLAQ
ncbi:MAG: SRPBCC family protein [Planctomycetota bacterium]